MKNFNKILALLIQPGLLLLPLLWATPAQAQSAATYSNSGAQPQTDVKCVLTACSGKVTNPEKATDANLDNYATLNLALLNGYASLKMPLSSTVPAYSRAGVVLSSSSGGLVDLSGVGEVRLSTYRTGVAAPVQRVVVERQALQAALSSTQRIPVEFLATAPFDQVRIEYYGLANVSLDPNLIYDLRVFYAYGIISTQAQQVAGYLSRFPTPAATDYATSIESNGVTVCANTATDHPERAVDASLDNYASFRTLLDVNCPATLQVHLEGTSPAGYQAGFVIGNGGLLDVSVLNNLKLTTYLGNQPQESASGTDLLRLTALPDNSGRYQVSFAGSMPFDRVEIQRTAALSVLDNLRLYYGFGIEPKAFRDLTPVLSDNPTAQAGTNYQTESNSLICAGCTIQNPERAADALIADSDYARIISTVGALGTQKLKIKLNGTGLAGNTAGIVLNNGGNLLSSSVLQNIRISTYSGASGDTYVESVTGSALIQSQILSGNRQEISFPTTRDFEWIELEIPNGVSLLNDVHVFYGFAEDRPFSFPSQVVPPILLPVELVQLTAVETTAGVLVRWSTASEKQSQHFVVERAVAAGTAATSFQRLGEVAAAGNTTQAHSYSFLDANVAPLTAPILYYRLRVVNEDGGENLSPVVVVKHQVGRGITLTVSPNPAAASEEVQLQVASPALENAVLHIYNTQGKLVRRLVNNARQRLQLQGLPAGLYHVVLLANSGQRLASQKLIIREP